MTHTGVKWIVVPCVRVNSSPMLYEEANDSYWCKVNREKKVVISNISFIGHFRCITKSRITTLSPGDYPSISSTNGTIS